jgi:peptidoglycan/LPS O-acetylase OafA/YrhL
LAYQPTESSIMPAIPAGMSNERSAGLDCIRGASALAVVAAHYFGSLAGIPAVDVFFVLSGYLLTGQLIDKRIGVSAFYIRRIARTWPLYIVLLAGFFTIHPHAKSFGYFTFTQNFYWASVPLALLPTWSLAIEEQYYLLQPALLTVGARRHLPFLLLAILVATVAIRATVDPQAAFYWTPARLDAPTAGALLAWAVRTPTPIRPLLSNRAALWAIAAAAGLVLIVSCDGIFTGITQNVTHPVAIVLAVAMILLAQDKSPQALRWLAWVGQRSYPIYLFNFPLYRLTNNFAQGPSGIVLGLVLTLALSSALHVLVERPIHKLARKATPSPVGYESKSLTTKTSTDA